MRHIKNQKAVRPVFEDQLDDLEAERLAKEKVGRKILFSKAIKKHLA
jgi:hypothetical protein